MNRLAVSLAATFLLGAAGAGAQGLPPGGRGESQPRAEAPRAPGIGRTMEEILFAPELVMRNQRAIGLRDEQQEAIRAEMQKAVARFTDLQWQQSSLVEALEAACLSHPVDEKAALAAFDKLLAVEGEIKRLHFASLVRVKNVLTPAQQAQLRELGRRERPRPGDRQPPPGGDPGAPEPASRPGR